MKNWLGQFYFLNLSPKDINRLYIMSDPHAYHKNLCSGSTSWSVDTTRNFDDQYAMTDCLVENINNTVGSDDILLSLGDWSFGGQSKLVEFRNRINCRNVAVIFGNHDKGVWRNRDLFIWAGHYTEFNYDGIRYCCCHYPIISWNGLGNGSVMLHGHCHNNLNKFFSRGRMFEMGLDNPRWEFKPVKLTELHKIAINTQIFTPDHH